MRFQYLPLAMLATIGLAEPIPELKRRGKPAYSVGSFKAIPKYDELFYFTVTRNKGGDKTKCLGGLYRTGGAPTNLLFMGACPGDTYWLSVMKKGVVRLEVPAKKNTVDRYEVRAEAEIKDIADLTKVKQLDFKKSTKTANAHKKDEYEEMSAEMDEGRKQQNHFIQWANNRGG